MKTLKNGTQVILLKERKLDILKKVEVFHAGLRMTVYNSDGRTYDLIDQQGRLLNEVSRDKFKVI